ncbi:MAG: tautomerase family protein [Bacilli bacterium]|nr:tautomerase family protein [Bacilli bacterium]
MPFVSIKTNQVLNDVQKEEVKAGLGKYIELLPGKTESWLMVEIDDARELYFQGKKEPAAMIEVKMFGGANQSSLENFTKKVTEFISEKINVKSSRIYISYFATIDWGFDGSNF